MVWPISGPCMDAFIWTVLRSGEGLSGLRASHRRFGDGEERGRLVLVTSDYFE